MALVCTGFLHIPSYWRTHAAASPKKKYSSANQQSVPVHFEYERKLEDLRQLLKGEDAMTSLMRVDAIQRLGVGNHYQNEINTILSHHYYKTRDGHHRCTSLHDVSLSFRLLRCHGYNVPTDVFKGFHGADGKLSENLRQDIRGLMELYEATQLSFEGENILDEAQEFSKRILHQYCISDHSNHNIRIRLRHPYQKSMTQFTQRSIILNDTDGTKNLWEETLREIVEMDFQMQKSLFQVEVHQVSRWWDDLGLTNKLTRARAQTQKWYTWSMAMLIGDISLSEQRVQLAQAFSFIYLIDDIFDLYGTPHELAIFTEAVEKWDYAAIAMLPEYMKPCYKALLDTISDIAYAIYRKHGHNPIHYLKQTWASLCNSFLVEAKWFASNNLPKAQEYLDNGKLSCGAPLILTHLYFVLGLAATNKDDILFNRLSTHLSSIATIFRLWDDFGSAEDEHQDGTDGSYITCYMNDNPQVSYKEAKEHALKMIATEWKLLNYNCFSSRNWPTSSFQESSLNLARMVPLMYSYDENQQLPALKKYVYDAYFNN